MRNGALPAAVPRHAPPQRDRRRGAWRPTTCATTTACSPSARSSATCTARTAGPSAPGPGTRRPTRGVFRPLPGEPREGDLVWIGNWGDDERTAELHEFLLEPVQALGLQARVHGVRYPAQALAALRAGGHRLRRLAAQLRGARACSRATASPCTCRAGRTCRRCRASRPSACSRRWPAASRWSPRRGTTAKACSSPAPISWSRATAPQMREHLRAVLHDPALARALADHGRATILARHTCAHRVDELLAIHAELGRPAGAPAVRGASAAHAGAQRA